MGEGPTKFITGTALGVACGFVLGSVAASPATRSVSRSVGESLATSARFVRRVSTQAFDEFGASLESGYTRVRGREAYLEHEIDQLREKISHLEQRID